MRFLYGHQYNQLFSKVLWQDFSKAKIKRAKMNHNILKKNVLYDIIVKLSPGKPSHNHRLS